MVVSGSCERALDVGVTLRALRVELLREAMPVPDKAVVLYGQLQALLDASTAPAVEKALTVLILGAHVYSGLENGDAADFRAALDDIIKRL